MKMNTAITRMEKLGTVTVDNCGDATVNLGSHTLTAVWGGPWGDVGAIFTRSAASGHQRFHRSLKAAKDYLKEVGAF